MNACEMYAEADRILETCAHTDVYRSEVHRPGGETLLVCCDCWNRHVHARRAARRQELAEWRATLPRCERCGKKPANWTVGRWHLCGHCKEEVKREHYRNLAHAGALAIFATGLCVDTSTWANLPHHEAGL